MMIHRHRLRAIEPLLCESCGDGLPIGTPILYLRSGRYGLIECTFCASRENPNREWGHPDCPIWLWLIQLVAPVWAISRRVWIHDMAQRLRRKHE
jgi:hypothetical protein